jgi:acetate kinase
MHVLVLNCGSSSLRADVIDVDTKEAVASAEISRVDDRPGDGHRTAVEEALDTLLKDEAVDQIDAVGHRVVHGGEAFSHPVEIDAEVEATIDSLQELAPLHNPHNLTGIRVAGQRLPEVPQFAVFDTGFHGTLPSRARHYAIAQEIAERHGVRRFGFHGISHEFVANRAATFLGSDVQDLRLITCHLGNGCSVCAVEYGSSVETSMGMTPMEGLVMGTRSGDIDPGAILHLLRQDGWDVDRVDRLLNKESGLEGVSGISNDLRDIKRQAAEGNEDARMAIQVFSHRVRKYIGAYAAVMGGADAIVLTGGIGENSALMRHRVGQRLEFLGARIDEDANRDAVVDDDTPVADISSSTSRCRLLVVQTDEQRAIGEKVGHLMREKHVPGDAGATIPIAVSGRHCHLTQETVETLFGEGYTLTPRNDLSQPGQFAAEETVRVVGPDGALEKVRILGPTRDYNQVEVARTDEFKLGIDAPVRMSGDIEQSAGVTLVGDAGDVTLSEGLICAWRHIHMTPEDARRFGVEHRDVVEVAVDTDERDLVFGDVVIRVSEDYKLEMHIDTDEANAANLPRRSEGVLVDSGALARLNRRKTTFA